MDKIKIISEPSESQPFIVLYKTSGLPSAPISADDEDNAFSMTAKLFPEVLTVSGRKEIEHGLLHRLDTVTSGLLMIATSQAFYDYMLEEQKNGRFVKYYEAECIDCPNNSELLKGFPPVDFDVRKNILYGEPVIVSSYFRNYGAGQKEVRPVSQSSNPAIMKKIGKQVIYNTEIKLINRESGVQRFKCKLTAGYRHQVRAHLSWLGFPIKGDGLYNFYENEKKSIKPFEIQSQIKFSATAIEFDYNRKTLRFDQNPDF